MSYALEDEEPAGAGLVRVISEQVEKLTAECGHARADPAAFVHKARVRCKRIRAALRLLRPAIGGKAYATENGWWRNVARSLSELRDLTARSEALAAVGPETEAEIGAAVVRRLRWQFDRERRAHEAGAGPGDLIGKFCEAVAGHDFSAFDDIRHEGGKMLAHGLAKTYGKARAAMADAYEGDAPNLFHEWRKQTKYHALQLRLVRHVYPALQPRIQAARDLADLLGAVQDIEVLVSGLSPHRDGHIVTALEVRRRAMLEGARVAGEALFPLKPKAWARALDREPAAADL